MNKGLDATRMSGREPMEFGRGDVETVTQTLELKLIEAAVFGSTPRFARRPLVVEQIFPEYCVYCVT